ncbi:MAG: FtsQ-type POTRA domain-containing protein [Clostridia bacterium]|nr:FtsQ-type POTRA domain-containing protein [Clostridia bacterium]
MGKSVNEYYSEKMKRLLEMQKNNATATLAAPVEKQNTSRMSPERQAPKKDGKREYYDDFRKRIEHEKAGVSLPPSHSRQNPRPRPKTPAERTAVDDIRQGRVPARRHESINARPEGAKAKAGQSRPLRKRVSPEQTARDRYEENIRRLEALETARRARVMRMIRDGLVSFLLIFAVLTVMCVVVYRLLFVIGDIRVEGADKYSQDEIVLASGVDLGDHLYSFSSREMGELLMLRCPEIDSVDVDRTPPGKIEINVTEEKPAFYADFYGEYRLLSTSLRLLRSVTEEEAVSLGCVKIKLPDIVQATAGKNISFADVRNDKYIYDTCRALLESELCGRVGTVDVSDKFNMYLIVDSKYKIKLGDSESIETKLRIAAAVLEDEMFDNDVKALIDVTDLSETSVVVDDGLKLD